eukprot:Hpha_TRINITY_DN5153_c0_g2::TRINITY_DN5153_c0_g2_i1::g.193042::m.193042
MTPNCCSIPLGQRPGRLRRKKPLPGGRWTISETGYCLSCDGAGARFLPKLVTCDSNRVQGSGRGSPPPTRGQNVKFEAESLLSHAAFDFFFSFFLRSRE